MTDDGESVRLLAVGGLNLNEQVLLQFLRPIPNAAIRLD